MADQQLSFWADAVPEATFTLATLRCGCGSDVLLGVEPGDQPVYAPGEIVIKAGKPIRGLCAACSAWVRQA